MSKRSGTSLIVVALALGLAGFGIWYAFHDPKPDDNPTAGPSTNTLEQQFTSQVRPFVEQHCLSCHSGAKPEGGLDLNLDKDAEAVAANLRQWDRVAERLQAAE